MELLLLGVCVLLGVNLVRTLNLHSGPDPSKSMDAKGSISGLDGLIARHGKSKAYVSSDVAKLATKLDEAYCRIEPHNLNKRELLMVMSAHKQLKMLSMVQRGWFSGAYNDVWVKISKKCPANEDPDVWPLQLALDHSLSNELTDLEEVIERLLSKVLTKFLGDKDQDSAFNLAKKRLGMVKYRILGLVAPLIPCVLDKALGNPTIIPALRQIFAENYDRIIKQEKGWFTAGAAKLVLTEQQRKDRVLDKFDPKIGGALKTFKKVIQKRCDEWQNKANTLTWVPSREHQQCLVEFGLVKKTKPAKVTKKPIKGSKVTKKPEKVPSKDPLVSLCEVSQDASMALMKEQSDAKSKEYEEALEELKYSLTICYAVIAALAVCLVFSWLYAFFFLCKSKPGKPDGDRKTAKKRRERRDTAVSNSSVDLEAGISSSRKDRADTADSYVSCRPARSVRDGRRRKRSHRSERKDRHRSHRSERRHRSHRGKSQSKSLSRSATPELAKENLLEKSYKMQNRLGDSSLSPKSHSSHRSEYEESDRSNWDRIRSSRGEEHRSRKSRSESPRETSRSHRSDRSPRSNREKSSRSRRISVAQETASGSDGEN